MEPKPIPPKLLAQGVGIPKQFNPPAGMEDIIGELHMLVLPHPDEIRALLKGEDISATKGSKDFWITWWEPNEIERRMIAKGAPIRVTFIGLTSVSPMTVDVGYNLEGNTEYGQEGRNN